MNKNNNREAASKVLDSNMSDFTRKHIDKVHYLEGWLIDAMVEYKAEETHRDGSIAVIEKPEFPPNREKPTNGLQKLLLWIYDRREPIRAKEKIYHMNWPKDGLLENLPNNLQKDKSLHNSHTIAELNKTGRECVERVDAYVQNNEKHNESLRDKDKIIESLEREVKKLNAIIKENL